MSDTDDQIRVVEFFRDRYEEEIQRKNQLDTNNSVILGIKTASYISIYVLFVEALEKLDYNYFATFFIFLILYVGFVLYSTWKFSQAFISREYKSLNFSSEILGYAEKIKSDYPPEYFYEVFYLGILPNYVEACDHNTTTNDLRANDYYECKRLIAFSTWPLFFSFLVLAWGMMDKKGILFF